MFTHGFLHSLQTPSILLGFLALALLILRLDFNLRRGFFLAAYIAGSALALGCWQLAPAGVFTPRWLAVLLYISIILLALPLILGADLPHSRRWQWLWLPTAMLAFGSCTDGASASADFVFALGASAALWVVAFGLVSLLPTIRAQNPIGSVALRILAAWLLAIAVMMAAQAWFFA